MIACLCQSSLLFLNTNFCLIRTDLYLHIALGIKCALQFLPASRKQQNQFADHTNILTKCLFQSVSATAFIPCLHGTPSCVAERCLWLKTKKNQSNISFASSCEIFLVIHIGYSSMFLLSYEVRDSTSLRTFFVFLKWSKPAGVLPFVNLNNPAIVSGRLGSALLPELGFLDLLWFLWFSSSATLEPF